MVTLTCLLLVSNVTGIGQASLPPLDSTPTVHVYLPWVGRQFPPTRTVDPAKEQAIADLINQERSSQGLPPLTVVPELTQAARRHSRDMSEHSCLDHTGSDGSTPGQRIDEAGYHWAVRGENVGWDDTGDLGNVLDAWMNSPTHRANILRSTFEDFGVSHITGPKPTGPCYEGSVTDHATYGSRWGDYFTVVFGKR